MRLPGSLTVHPAAVQPRDLGLAGIETAFETDAVETWGLDALGIDTQRAGEAGSPTRVLAMQTVKKERRCRMLEGTADAQADTLVRWLQTKGMMG